MSAEYVPDAGHIVWIDFDPQTGREQRGTRPALVLTPASYNDKTSLSVVCPLTTNVKGYPFEVLVEGLPNARGAVLSDHVKSLDWRIRRAKYIATIGAAQLKAVRSKLSALLGI